MKEDVDGLPVVGSSARMLGVRPGGSPTPDVLAVHPADPVLPGQGGMSVAPDDPRHLQRHRRPVSLGGTGHEPVWYIETEDLEPDLYFRQDRPTHGVIEPKCPMRLQVYQDALAGTRPRWKIYAR
jgi:hypothetical protein